jgi:hypothetical protein
MGVAGGVAGGAFGGPLGAAAGVAVGAGVGAGLVQLSESYWPDIVPKEVLDGLDANSSALALIVQDRYAERLDEELRKLGRTIQRELKRDERDAEFDAYVERSKNKIRSIEDDIKARLAKAQTATAAEKSKIEADVAVKRAELEAQREKLEDQIKAMSNDLKSEIRELNFRLELAGLRAKSGIAASTDNLHRQLNHFNDELEDVIERQIDTMKRDTSDLKTRAAKASGETKAAIEDHLLVVGVRLHKERDELQDSFEERQLQMRQWFDTLRVQSSLLQANLRDKIQANLDAAQHSFAELKARVRTMKREDERAWKDIRAGFNKAAKDLATAFDQAKHERA